MSGGAAYLFTQSVRTWSMQMSTWDDKWSPSHGGRGTWSLPLPPYWLFRGFYRVISAHYCDHIVQQTVIWLQGLLALPSKQGASKHLFNCQQLTFINIIITAISLLQTHRHTHMERGQRSVWSHKVCDWMFKKKWASLCVTSLSIDRRKPPPLMERRTGKQRMRRNRHKTADSWR